MTGPLGNIAFSFPRISIFPLTSSRDTFEILGKQNSLFSKGPVVKFSLFTGWLADNSDVSKQLLSTDFGSKWKYRGPCGFH